MGISLPLRCLSTLRVPFVGLDINISSTAIIMPDLRSHRRCSPLHNSTIWTLELLQTRGPGSCRVSDPFMVDHWKSLSRELEVEWWQQVDRAKWTEIQAMCLQWRLCCCSGRRWVSCRAHLTKRVKDGQKLHSVNILETKNNFKYWNAKNPRKATKGLQSYREKHSMQIEVGVEDVAAEPRPALAVESWRLWLVYLNNLQMYIDGKEHCQMNKFTLLASMSVYLPSAFLWIQPSAWSIILWDEIHPEISRSVYAPNGNYMHRTILVNQVPECTDIKTSPMRLSRALIISARLFHITFPHPLYPENNIRNQHH